MNTVDDEFDPLPNDADDAGAEYDDAHGPMQGGAAAPLNSVVALVAAAYRDATNRRQRHAVSSAPAIAVVISVPSAAWVAPVSELIRREASWQSVVVADGTSTRWPLGNADVARLLSKGGRIVGVSHAPDRLLPSALLAAADHRISIAGVSDKVLRRAISQVVGGRVPKLEPGTAAGVDLLDLASAIRIGTTPASCIARLKAAREVASGGNQDLAAVPLIGELHGYGKAKVWGQALCRDLDAWRRGELAWDRVRSAVVLSGPPGCGKTTFARSLAKSAGLPFFPSSVAGWFTGGGYLHEVIRAFDTVIAQASAAAPALVFLDEIDALPNRRDLDSRNADYWRVLIARVLEVLDGASSGKTAARLVIVGATNHPDILDPALTRPGRLEEVI